MRLLPRWLRRAAPDPLPAQQHLSAMTLAIETCLVAIPPGVKGLDCNTTVTAQQAADLVASGFRFIFRYIRNEQYHQTDLTADELSMLMAAGLAVMPVQHVTPAYWVPTANLGHEHGATAANGCITLPILPGCSVWMDLEGVRPGTLQQQVIDYGNNWYDALKVVGYNPGCYVGDHPGLPAMPLYNRLKFRQYWSAYNLDKEQYPAVRGVQVTQHAARPEHNVPSSVIYPVDVDFSQEDQLRGLPLAMASTRWRA